MMSIGCPRCGGAIRCNGTLEPGGLTIALDPFDVRRHAPCFSPPPNGEPIPVAA